MKHTTSSRRPGDSRGHNDAYYERSIQGALQQARSKHLPASMRNADLSLKQNLPFTNGSTQRSITTDLDIGQVLRKGQQQRQQHRTRQAQKQPPAKRSKRTPNRNGRRSEGGIFGRDQPSHYVPIGVHRATLSASEVSYISQTVAMDPIFKSCLASLENGIIRHGIQFYFNGRLLKDMVREPLEEVYLNFDRDCLRSLALYGMVVVRIAPHETLTAIPHVIDLATIDTDVITDAYGRREYEFRHKLSYTDSLNPNSHHPSSSGTSGGRGGGPGMTGYEHVGQLPVGGGQGSPGGGHSADSLHTARDDFGWNAANNPYTEARHPGGSGLPSYAEQDDPWDHAGPVGGGSGGGGTWGGSDPSSYRFKASPGTVLDRNVELNSGGSSRQSTLGQSSGKFNVTSASAPILTSTATVTSSTSGARRNGKRKRWVGEARGGSDSSAGEFSNSDDEQDPRRRRARQRDRGGDTKDDRVKGGAHDQVFNNGLEYPSGPWLHSRYPTLLDRQGKKRRTPHGRGGEKGGGGGDHQSTFHAPFSHKWQGTKIISDAEREKEREDLWRRAQESQQGVGGGFGGRGERTAESARYAEWSIARENALITDAYVFDPHPPRVDGRLTSVGAALLEDLHTTKHLNALFVRAVQNRATPTVLIGTIPPERAKGRDSRHAPDDEQHDPRKDLTQQPPSQDEQRNAIINLKALQRQNLREGGGCDDGGAGGGNTPEMRRSFLSDGEVMRRVYAGNDSPGDAGRLTAYVTGETQTAVQTHQAQVVNPEQYMSTYMDRVADLMQVPKSYWSTQAAKFKIDHAIERERMMTTITTNGNILENINNSVSLLIYGPNKTDNDHWGVHTYLQELSRDADSVDADGNALDEDPSMLEELTDEILEIPPEFVESMVYQLASRHRLWRCLPLYFLERARKEKMAALVQLLHTPVDEDGAAAGNMSPELADAAIGLRLDPGPAPPNLNQSNLPPPNTNKNSRKNTGPEEEEDTGPTQEPAPKKKKKKNNPEKKSSDVDGDKSRSDGRKRSRGENAEGADVVTVKPNPPMPPPPESVPEKIPIFSAVDDQSKDAETRDKKKQKKQTKENDQAEVVDNDEFADDEFADDKNKNKNKDKDKDKKDKDKNKKKKDTDVNKDVDADTGKLKPVKKKKNGTAKETKSNSPSVTSSAASSANLTTTGEFNEKGTSHANNNTNKGKASSVDTERRAEHEDEFPHHGRTEKGNDKSLQPTDYQLRGKSRHPPPSTGEGGKSIRRLQPDEVLEPLLRKVTDALETLREHRRKQAATKMHLLRWSREDATEESNIPSLGEEYQLDARNRHQDKSITIRLGSLQHARNQHRLPLLEHQIKCREIESRHNELELEDLRRARIIQEEFPNRRKLY